MSCNFPLKGFQIGLTKNGKPEYKIVPYKTDNIEFINGSWQVVNHNERKFKAARAVYKFVKIPCGKCIQCRLEYAKSWAARCMLEMEKYDKNSFITLTYDDDSVPRSWIEHTDNYTGEVFKTRSGDLLSLNKKNLQDFFKRLRSHTSEPVRYFACGEYGESTFRPHYHFISFNYRPDDLVFYKRTPAGDSLYTSESLSKIWSYGNVIVADATYESACYVARYVMKKAKGVDSGIYDLYGIDPEFVTMSRKPGIANDFYQKHKDTDLFVSNRIHISSENGGKSFKPFRYFKKCYEQDYPGDLHYLTDNQKKFSEDFEKFQKSSTDKSYLEMLSDKEYILAQKQLKRKEI